MTRALLYVVMLMLTLNTSQTRGEVTEKKLTPVTSDTVVEGWQTGDILSSLLRAGFTNKIPLGIVLAFPFGLRGVGIWIGLAAGLAIVAVMLSLRWAARRRLGLVPVPA